MAQKANNKSNKQTNNKTRVPSFSDGHSLLEHGTQVAQMAISHMRSGPVLTVGCTSFPCHNCQAWPVSKHRPPSPAPDVSHDAHAFQTRVCQVNRGEYPHHGSRKPSVREVLQGCGNSGLSAPRSQLKWEMLSAHFGAEVPLQGTRENLQGKKNGGF